MTHQHNISIKSFLLGFLLMLSVCVNSQNTYQLNLADNSTFWVTCGAVNPAQWSVKEDSCMLYTPYLYPVGTTENIDVSFIIRINQSGNLDCEENAYIQHQINDEEWVTDTVLIGCGLDAVFTLSDHMILGTTDRFRFRIITETNEQTQFWAIKDGDIIINNVSITPPVLPIELVDFSGIIEDNSIHLTWITSSETNNSHFIIEKSEDGVTFESLSQKAGTGNSNQLVEYSIIDEQPLSGNNFYRIKQVDVDGKFTYSPAILIKFMQSLNQVISVFADGNALSFKLLSDEATTGKIECYSMTGKLIFSNCFSITEGTNQFQIDTKDQLMGIYIIRITSLSGLSHIQRLSIKR